MATPSAQYNIVLLIVPSLAGSFVICIMDGAVNQNRYGILFTVCAVYCYWQWNPEFSKVKRLSLLFEQAG